jgi:hypothetical protein
LNIVVVGRPLLADTKEEFSKFLNIIWRDKYNLYRARACYRKFFFIHASPPPQTA